MNIRLLFFLYMVLASAAALLAQNLVTVNPSFEAANAYVGGFGSFDDDWSIPGWRVSGNTPGGFVGTDDAARTGGDGSRYLYLHDGFSAETAATARIPVTLGSLYQVSALALMENNLTAALTLGILWYGGNSAGDYSPVGSVVESVLLTGPTTHFGLVSSGSYAPPVGATHAAVYFTAPAAGTINLSMASLEVIPEPAHFAAFAGLAMLALAWARRRSSGECSE
jgi:MYXO-CTERM domain-containing protein